MIISIVFACGLLTGCAAGYCRTSKAAVQNVFVYKPDGSLQCGQGKKIPLEEMAKQLDGIKIISSRNAHDGMMHPTVCGAPTGRINIYEIPLEDLEKAKALNFKELKK